ncbi:hypothetical protein QQF64_036467 [Cirrhinus molitorella]|uniref:BED-type domain-containing protein n=1 Tax=Cirrhinus molitorella TaxID=172907 RepID=A0ABR3NIV8_9TELE
MSSRLRAVAQVTGLILLLNTQHTKRTQVTSGDDMLGRRKRLDIWSHFKYNDTDKKSECVIITDGKHCGQRISGKNTTNLKRHLKANHPHIQIPDVVKQPARKEERPSMSGAFFSHIKYKPDSQEQRIKEEAIAKWVARTAHPPRTVEDEEFINMMEKIDKRLTVPKKTKITNLVDQMYLGRSDFSPRKKQAQRAKRIWVSTFHLSDFSLAHARSYRDVATLAQKMSANMDLRFSCFLDVSASNFSPLAAAACFVDASVSAETLIDNDNDDIQNLLSKAEEYITRSVPYQEEVTDDEDIRNAEVSEVPLQKRPRFRLAMARKVTIGIDIWTKKGLTASFLAVSACYFNVQDSKAEHILLNLKQMVHPHTANSIITLVEECTEEWGIPKEKIIMIITDNGSNMVSAFRVEEEDTSSDENDSKDSDEEEEADERSVYMEPWRGPQCVVHTLQLVVNMVKKEQAIKRLLDKIRHLVRQFRKSSVAIERLLEQCGLILIKDCETRWSSSFLMLSRLLEVKDHVTSVADTMGWDCLLPSEWQKVAILKDLLLPFAEHTKVLESDTCCFSLVVPAILDLRSHLSDFSLAHARSYRDVATLAQKMSANMDLRFSCFLDVSASNFSPLAAAACFVDASVSAETLIDNDNDDIQNLLSKAEE